MTDLLGQGRRLLVLDARAQGGQQGLVTGKDDGSVLEQGPAQPCLSASDEFAAANNDLTFGRALKARAGIQGERTFPGWAGAENVRTQRPHRIDQSLADCMIRGTRTTERPCRNDDRVRQLRIVKNGATTRGATHDVDAEPLSHGRIVQTTRRLIPTERHRRP